ncbi:MAG: EF-hand domain-containing protein [Marivita sp.]|uniref:EF-hand domain-containing protein n=1 Tax=Marivita sp. TaxID=2003365 RepID=UPI003EF6EBD5
MFKSSLIVALLFAATTATAQNATPGGHFVESWDLNGDGQVTLAEATERRADVFLSFDADENGMLTSEEHDLFDEARAMDMAENGEGHGTGKRNPANGMLREVTDANGDGNVTREEFLNAVPAWFAGMDRNGDNMVTTADFGRG